MKLRKSISPSIFIIFLYLLFAILALLLVSVGARVYSDLSDSMTNNYDMRTSLSYVSTKVRQSDVADNVKISQIKNAPAIILSEDIEGEKYETWIYFDGQTLREMYIQQGVDFDLSAGNKIIDLSDFQIDIKNNMLYLYAENINGVNNELYLNIRTGDIADIKEVQ